MKTKPSGKYETIFLLAPMSWNVAWRAYLNPTDHQGDKGKPVNVSA